MVPTAESPHRRLVASLRTSQRGLEHIKGFEKLRLEAYDDGYGNLTIGWGHKIGPGDPHKMSEAMAETYLRQDIATAEFAIKRWVRVKLYQHEFDAIVGLVYNIGAGKFSNSTLLYALNQERYDLAALEFPKWRKANGKISNGLKRRRAIEERIFRTGVYNAK